MPHVISANDSLKIAQQNVTDALAAYNAGNYESAYNNFVKAAIVVPTDTGLIKDVALSAYAAKKYPEAARYFEKLIVLGTYDMTKKSLSQNYTSLGDCYHEMHDTKSSDKSYDKSLRYDANNVYTLNNYAYQLALRGENLDKAAAMAKHAVELSPAVATLEDTYAWVLFRKKKYTEAKIWMEKAVLHNKDKSAEQTEHYGDILFYTGDAEAALQNWKLAKEYGGDSPALERKISEKSYSE